MIPQDASKIVTGERIKTVAKIANNISLKEEDLKITGNKIELYHKTGYEEFAANEVFDYDVSNVRIYQQVVSSYCNAFIEGFNVSVLSFGSSTSEKTKLIEQSKEEEGLFLCFLEDFYQKMDHKRSTFKKKGKEMHWTLRFGAIEVVDEAVQDLLGGNGARVEETDWEGPRVTGSVEHAVLNFSRSKELFNAARNKRTRFVSEFGPLIQKSTCIYILELTQVIGGDGTLIHSKAYFTDFAAIDVFLDDSEAIRQREGPTLSKPIFALKNVLTTLVGISKDVPTEEEVRARLSKSTFVNKKDGNNQGFEGVLFRQEARLSTGVCFYEASQTTKLLREAFGGNCYTIAMISLSNGDQRGSLASLRLMSVLRRIVNFPVLNEGNLLGLLRKFREETRRSRELAGVEAMSQNRNANYRDQIEYKRALEEDVEKIKQIEKTEKLTARLGELRERYNQILRAKGELQGELIKSEEEKLQISRALVELQLENARLLEELHQEQFAAGTRLAGQEAELLVLQTKEEKAAEVLSELQSDLQTTVDEKKDLETELLVLKRNFNNVIEEKEKSERRTQEVELELVNLLNEKKMIDRRLHDISDGSDTNERKLYEEQRKYQEILKDFTKLREAFIQLTSENENLKTKCLKSELDKKEKFLELEGKQIELQRGLLDAGRKKANELEELANDFEKQRISKEDKIVILESEKRELLIKNRTLLRRAEELSSIQIELGKERDAIKVEKAGLVLQLDEMRNVFRAKLLQYVSADSRTNCINGREDLLRTYADRERELLERIEKGQLLIKHTRMELTNIKKYARELRSLAEDWAPIGQPLPEILICPVPFSSEPNDRVAINRNQVTNRDLLDSKMPISQATKFESKKENEADNLKENNKGCNQGLKNSREKFLAVDVYGNNVNKNRQETDSLKQFLNQAKAGDRENYPSNAETESLKQEVNRLKEEIIRLRIICKSPTNELLMNLQTENERLVKKIQVLDEKPTLQNNSNTFDVASLKKKIMYLEKIIQSLEIERSQLLSRAAHAEESFKAFQDKHGRIVKELQAKISDLKNQLSIK